MNEFHFYLLNLWLIAINLFISKTKKHLTRPVLAKPDE